jgi:tetratricopeptide (TPR) repeat protein
MNKEQKKARTRQSATLFISLVLVTVVVVSLIAPFVSSRMSNTPSEAEQYAALATEAFDNGDHSGAISYWNQSIQLDSSNTYLYLGRGMAYYLMGEMNQAIADFNQSIQLNPNLAITYYCRGVVYYSLSEMEKAIADFQQCLTLNPDEDIRQEVETYLEELGVTP